MYIASDHAGFALKEFVKKSIEQNWHDLGPQSEDSCDYPDFAHELCEKALAEDSTKEQKGILLCGSGIGMSIAANKHEGIRAALCMNSELAKMSRLHNNSNVLVLGARFISEENALEIVKTWLETEFEGGRHQARVDKIELNKVH